MKDYFEKYYSVLSGGKRGELVVQSIDDFCDNDYEFLAGKEKLKEKPVFKQHMGTRQYDFIASTYAILDMISDKFLNVLKENKFTGWDTYPVKILDKKGFEIKGYRGLIVPGKCGPINEDLSKEIIYTAPSGEKLMEWKGLYFDPKTHDGSDFVVPEGTGYVIVKERVKTALEKAKITNIELIRLTEYIIPYREGLS